MIPIFSAYFSDYGIELKKLRTKHLPMLCNQRNKPEILRYLDDTRKVNVNVLNFWLKKAEKYGTVFPFLAYYRGEPVGYIDIHNYNYEKNTGEDAIFLFDHKKIGKGLGTRIFMCREKLITALNIREIFSYIRVNNVHSIKFFEKFGAQLIGKKDEFLLYKQQSCIRKNKIIKLCCQFS